MLELRNVTTKAGGSGHIRDVNLSLRHGSLSVLIGPTLSGKATPMRPMAGLDQPTSGPVLFDGADMTGVPVQKRNAMVYQQFINYDELVNSWPQALRRVEYAGRGRDLPPLS